MLIDTTASKAYTRRSAFELKNEGSGKLGAKFQPHRAAAHMGRAHPVGTEKERWPISVGPGSLRLSRAVQVLAHVWRANRL